MLDAYIYDGLRTPFGRHAGSLAAVRPDDLIADVMRALVARSPWQAAQLDDVVIGCVTQSGEDARNIARNALLVAGFTKVDYIEVRDAETLAPFNPNLGRPGRVLGAAWLGNTRLIDNVPC